MRFYLCDTGHYRKSRINGSAGQTMAFRTADLGVCWTLPSLRLTAGTPRNI
jgi:hypothetical protein